MKKLAIEGPRQTPRVALSLHKRVWTVWTIQHMAKEDILKLIPADIQEEIKRDDPNPVYRAYSIAHEGLIKGNQVGFGQTIRKYIGSAIRKIYEKLALGTKIFHGHNKDNSHEGRKSIGKVVGKKIEDWRNRLTAFAVMYIFPEFRDLPLDVASIEADLLIDSKNNDTIQGVNVNDITGIALGNSAAGWMPGFEGAELVAEIQAFASQAQGGAVDKITIDELKTLVKEEKIKPSDIFGVESLAADAAVEGFIVEEKKRAVSGEYAHRKRQEEAFDEKRKELEAFLQRKDEEISGLKLSAAKSKVGPLFEKIKSERKLDERQVKYIQPALDRFEPKEIANIEKELDAYVDEHVKEYSRVAKDVFGLGETKPDKKGGAEPADEKPFTNPFIPRL
jgi:hypothetical protein